MIGQFEYKSIHSSVYGVYFKTIKRPLMPPIIPKLVSINGSSGSYDFGDNDYGNVSIEVKIAYIPTSFIERKQRARQIASWLNSTTWQKLIFGDETDKYYLARVQGQVDLDALIAVGEANISFICQPFAYRVVDTYIDDVTWDEADFPWITEVTWAMDEGFKFTVITPSNVEFENVGTKEINFRSPQGSKFDIRINGSFTTLSLTLNGKILNYNQAVASGLVTIDNVNMEVDFNGINKLNVISGDLAIFLTTIPGSNVLNVSGTNLNVEVTIDFAPMYL